MEVWAARPLLGLWARQFPPQPNAAESEYASPALRYDHAYWQASLLGDGRIRRIRALHDPPACSGRPQQYQGQDRQKERKFETKGGFVRNRLGRPRAEPKQLEQAKQMLAALMVSVVFGAVIVAVMFIENAKR